MGACVAAEPSAQDQPSPDERLELAYEAALKSVGNQDATLGTLRTRANNLLATPALFTSFSTAVGLIDTSRNNGPVLSPKIGFRGIRAGDRGENRL